MFKILTSCIKVFDLLYFSARKEVERKFCFPTTLFTEEAIFQPMFILDTFVEEDMFVWVYFLALNSASLIHSYSFYLSQERTITTMMTAGEINDIK